VAQPNLGGNLCPCPASFVRSDDLPPSLMLFGWTELSGIVFLHASMVAENPCKINLFAGRINSHELVDGRESTDEIASLQHGESVPI